MAGAISSGQSLLGCLRCGVVPKIQMNPSARNPWKTAPQRSPSCKPVCKPDELCICHCISIIHMYILPSSMKSDYV